MNGPSHRSVTEKAIRLLAETQNCQSYPIGENNLLEQKNGITDLSQAAGETLYKNSDTDSVEDLEFVDVDAGSGVGRDDPHVHDYDVVNDVAHHSERGYHFTAFQHFIDLGHKGIYDDYDGYSYRHGSASENEYEPGLHTKSDWLIKGEFSSKATLDADLNYYFNDEYVHSPGMKWYRNCSPAVWRYTFNTTGNKYDQILSRYPLAERKGKKDCGIPYSVFTPVDNLGRYWYERFLISGDVRDLGPVMHAIQDACVPHHTSGYMGNWHVKYEDCLENEFETYSSLCNSEVLKLYKLWSNNNDGKKDRITYPESRTWTPNKSWRIDHLITWLACQSHYQYVNDYDGFKNDNWQKDTRFKDNTKPRELLNLAVAMSMLVFDKAKEEYNKGKVLGNKKVTSINVTIYAPKSKASDINLQLRLYNNYCGGSVEFDLPEKENYTQTIGKTKYYIYQKNFDVSSMNINSRKFNLELERCRIKDFEFYYSITYVTADSTSHTYADTFSSGIVTMFADRIDCISLPCTEHRIEEEERSNEVHFKSERIYTKYGTSPCNEETNYSKDVQGICHDDDAWYISHGAGTKENNRNYGAVHKIHRSISLSKKIDCTERSESPCKIYSKGVLETRRFFKYYNKNNEAIGFKIEDIHIGDIDCYNGYLFVPVYKKDDSSTADAQILIFDTKNFDLIHSEVLKKKYEYKFQYHTWCAINPNDGCLYTSDLHISNSFYEDNSPIMAFKINFENLKNKNGTVFETTTPYGIQLKKPDGTDFLMNANTQGGCFDPFDTLYISSGYYNNSASEGVFACKLNRQIENITNEYIKTRAYFIWEEKGRPIQTDAESKKDWQTAKWQIEDALNYGLLSFSKEPRTAVIFLETDNNNASISAVNYSLKDTITFSTQFEKPKGLTYWDLRRDDYRNDNPYSKNPLHILRLTSSKSEQTVYDTYSIDNISITSMESSDHIVNYNPRSLKVQLNPITGKWTIISNDYIPVWNYATDQEAIAAMNAMRNFQQLYIFGNKPSASNKFDLSKAILRLPINQTSSSHLASYIYEYDQSFVGGFDLGDATCNNPLTRRIDENEGYLFYWAIMLINSNKRSQLPESAYNETDVWKIFEFTKNTSKQCIVQEQVNKQYLLWFE